MLNKITLIEFHLYFNSFNIKREHILHLATEEHLIVVKNFIINYTFILNYV